MRVIFLAGLVASAMAQAPMIITPFGVVQCEPTLLTWSGGTAPYFLTVHSPDANGALVQDLGSPTGTSLSWTVPFASGQSLGLVLKDNTGLIGQSAPFIVGPGAITSCLGQTSASGASAPAPSGTGSASAPSTSGASTPAPAPAPTPTPAPAPPVSSAVSPPSITKPSSTAPPGSVTSSAKPTSSTPSKAMPTAQVGVVGVLGAVVAALLA